MVVNNRSVVTVTLLEGTIGGRWKCEISGWVGVAFRIPRESVLSSNDRDELKTPGVYFLIGADERGRNKVYVGEAEDPLSRLKQHLNSGSKEWQGWTESLIFISSHESLNKAKIKYMENVLYQKIKENGFWSLANGNTPTRSYLSENDRIDVDNYLERLHLLMRVMGFHFLESKGKTKQKNIDQWQRNKPEENHSKLYYIKDQKKGIDASGILLDGNRFLVRVGSKISKTITPSFPGKASSYFNLRNELIQQGVIRDGVLIQDYTFAAPSSAAAVVRGASSNGWDEWKDADGHKLDAVRKK